MIEAIMYKWAGDGAYLFTFLILISQNEFGNNNFRNFNHKTIRAFEGSADQHHRKESASNNQLTLCYLRGVSF